MTAELTTAIQKLHFYQSKLDKEYNLYWLTLKVQTMKKINELNRKILKTSK